MTPEMVSGLWISLVFTMSTMILCPVFAWVLLPHPKNA